MLLSRVRSLVAARQYLVAFLELVVQGAHCGSPRRHRAASIWMICSSSEVNSAAPILLVR